MIAELFFALSECVFELVVHLIVSLFTEGCTAICRSGQTKVSDYQRQKEEQEYQATLPNWSLLRSAHAPVSSYSQELLRPATGTTPTAKTELLRAVQETPHESDTARQNCSMGR